jgi:OPT oligopeptide transporter protein
MTFDEEAYKSYSPIYLPTTLALAYAIEFIGLVAVVTSVALNYLTRHQAYDNDSITIQSKTYETPHSWYIVLLVLMTMLSIIVCWAWPTTMPVWSILFITPIPFMMALPCGMFRAATGVDVGKISANIGSNRRVERCCRSHSGFFNSWSTTSKYDDKDIHGNDDGTSVLLEDLH